MTAALTTDLEAARARLCVALDLNDRQAILEVVDELKDVVGWFKLNSAFTLFGPELVREIRARGVDVFLDLKLHDIPNTLAHYAEAVTRLDVQLVTVHIEGGVEMMRRAVEAATKTAAELGRPRPRLVGITVLTSIGQPVLNGEMNIAGSVRTEVLRRARLAAEAGLDGIVCSAAELASVKAELPEGLFYVTPGVRPKGGSVDDHKRAVSYAEAIAAGSSMLVVGRGIMRADDRHAAALEILGLMTQSG
jgi:orotidine-5'-phosphate decarboxylase